MNSFSLKPHPDFGHPPITISVEIARTTEGDFVLEYVISGEVALIRIPEPVRYSSRHGNLWQHTCFEAFVAVAESESYLEFNFAPSTAWDAYRFVAYRQRGDELIFQAPHFDVEKQEQRLQIDLALDASDTPELPLNREWRLGLTAVIEAKDGTKSYWALAHGDGPPDFHNPDCFIATLPAPDAS